MSIVVSLEKFSKELDKLSKESIDKFKISVVDTLYEYLPRLVEKSPVDTGLYAQSWRVEVTEKTASLGNLAPYAPIIEFGARPFTPPLRPLLEWARRVLKKSTIDDECYALARGIQRKFAAHGMEPKHILTNSIPEIIESITKKMRGNLK